MLVRIGMELNNEGRDLAWALDFPGCFAYGNDGSEAVISLARELVAYDDWINLKAGKSWLQLGDFDLRIVETWQVVTMNDAYELEEGSYAVNAFFRNDWRPLTEVEIEQGMHLLCWSRQDLLQTAELISDENLDRRIEGQRWSIRGILKHVANAEWWYLDRLDLVNAEQSDMPKDAMERLGWVRRILDTSLADLSGRELVIGKQGEFWSPRKLLRRTLRHEIDHCRHIRGLLELYKQL